MKIKVIGSGSMWNKYNSACYMIDDDLMVDFPNGACNYLFLDCMLINASTKHNGIDKLEYLINKYKNCKYIVSHLENDTREKLKELDYGNVIVPNDGFTIEI